MIKLNLDYSKLNPEEINNIKPKTFSTGLAKNFPETNVWLELPNASKEYLQDIKDTAERIQSSVDYFVVIGVGGSSLGAKSAVRLLKKNNKVLFSGNSFDPTAIEYTMALCKGKKFAINLISRSGRTLEPLMSFEIFYKELLTRVSERQAKELVFVTTEKDSPLSSFAKEKAEGSRYYPLQDYCQWRLLELTFLKFFAVRKRQQTMRQCNMLAQDTFLKQNTKKVWSLYVLLKLALASFLNGKNNYSVKV